jgi:SAM-dependent methyltransferase
MHSTLSYTREELLQPRSILRHGWDLVGLPFRLALWPDAWNRRCGWSSLEEERLRAVLPQLKGRVLDIGAGANTLVRLYGQSSVGVDVHDFGGGATIVSDTRRLPFPDGEFDTVCFVACLNHIPYRKEALREAFRVVRPGGRLVATMIGRLVGDVGHKIWWYGEDRHRGGMAEGETGGLNVFEMMSLLREAGFAINDHRRFCYGLNHLYVAQKPAATPSTARRSNSEAA